MARPSPRFQRRRELDELRRRLMREQVQAQSSDAKTIAHLREQVTTLTARRPIVRTAAAAVPAIVLGAPQLVTVIWDQSMPVDDAYDLSIAVAPALIGRATWAVVERKKEHAELRISPVGASISLGQWLIATAVY